MAKIVKITEDKKVLFKEGQAVKFKMPKGYGFDNGIFGSPCVGEIIGHYEHQGDIYYRIATSIRGFYEVGIIAEDVELA